ncbi:LysR family transcriptional regulator [Streptomyces montanus]|uniref:LysR family transcriptional regulator n=1 Tax=Streptomyces montanus TaxID=2580423 RepID=A0A5R9FLB5_9ACTN|nr:substrate-binding domain-containing protein [Streptomyces montanus]TLS44662.1 LysR family transcriptional regulator [Streptomyces montanus]
MVPKTDHPAPPAGGPGTADAAAIRLGIHETPDLANDVIARAGARVEDFVLVPYDVRDPFRQLRAGQVDVMLVKFGPRENDIAVGSPVGFDARAVLVAADHPLASRDAVSVEEAASYDAFERPEGFPASVWDLIVPPRTPAGTPIRRVHTLTTIEALVRTLTTTRAVHLSFRSVEAALPPQVRAVPLSDLPSAPIALAWPNGAVLPARVRAFIRAAEADAAGAPTSS